jgi:hypothetical protein
MRDLLNEYAELKEAKKIWQMSASEYQASKGYEKPHIMAISPVQRGNMSKAANRRYDKERHAKSDVGHKIWLEYIKKVLAAFDRGEFDMKTRGASHEAKIHAMGHAKEKAKTAKVRADLDNQMIIPDISKGDRVWVSDMYGNTGWGKITRVLKAAVWVQMEAGSKLRGSAKDSKIKTRVPNVDRKRSISPIHRKQA